MEPLSGVVVIQSVGIRRGDGTAASCFSGRMQENQGLWDFKTKFLYQIYTRFIPEK